MDLENSLLKKFLVEDTQRFRHIFSSVIKMIKLIQDEAILSFQSIQEAFVFYICKRGVNAIYSFV